VLERVDRATVAEDIELVLAQLVDALVWIESGPLSVRLTAVFHRPEPPGVVVQPLDPFSAARGTGRRSRMPPHLQLPPESVLAEVARLSLEAQLRGILSGSLMVENLDRLRHMDAAGRHIEREAERLRLRRNVLRQEEITEEIELLLLSAESQLR
jgi:F-type H+-transporting ATPase subunit gamma